MPRFKDIKNAEDSNVLCFPAPPLSRHRPRAAPLSSPVRLVPLAQDLLHAPVSRTPGSRARYFSQFTQIRCPARAFRL